MKFKQFEVTFRGYTKTEDLGYLPEYSGIYFIYSCSPLSRSGGILLKQLIYIGQAHNIRDRILTHECLTEWLQYTLGGNDLAIATANVEVPDLDRVEAAYLNRHRPSGNQQLVSRFQFEKTRVITMGDVAFIDPDFVIDSKPGD